jgi:hypothetical protein
MAVTLSTDLIADVLRSADPVRLKTATAKLHDLQPQEENPGTFANLLNGIDGGRPAAAYPPAAPRSEDAYAEFERMVLRNLFESLLPQAESGAFGTGPSAGVWRSLAADQLAGVYAGSGGIGIASTLASESGGMTSQWPYFSTTKIEAFTG